jgi:ribosomal protein L7/L12
MRGLRKISVRLANLTLNNEVVTENMRQIAMALIAADGSDVCSYMYTCDGIRKIITFEVRHAFEIAAFLRKGEKIKAIFTMRREYDITLDQAKRLVEQRGDEIVRDLDNEQASQMLRRETGLPDVHEDYDATYEEEEDEEVIIPRSHERS